MTSGIQPINACTA